MRTLIFAAGLTIAALPALAGDHRVAPVRDALVQKECGQCHMTFQPGLLPAASWERMMDKLADHYGDNAAVSAEKGAAIRAYLTANAGRDRRGGTPSRITEARWFTHEHDFPAPVWKRPEVVTKSNCPACHQGAEQGLYDDD
ncbi:MAG: diheme cytochrome c [Rhodospirillaceae bacterium]|nr:diheme cytochrome c [Rhodospirillales bacterium]